VRRPNVFSGSYLDRIAHLRKDAGFLDSALADPDSLIVPLWQSRNLVRAAGPGRAAAFIEAAQVVSGSLAPGELLLLGRFPGWGYRWIGGLMGWTTRVQAYYQLLTPTYPPFSLSGEEHPVSVRFDEGVRINRLWGIPLVGMMVRWILLIPHLIVIWLLAIVVVFLLWFTWVPVLFMGRQSDLIYTVVGGFNRWVFRVMAYGYLMVDRYPPFSLGEDDPRL